MPVTHYKPGDAGFDDIAKTVTHVTKVRKEHSGTRTYIGADVGPIVSGRRRESVNKGRGQLMGMLKRKDPNQTFPDKICGWCGKTMVRVKQCNWQWQKMGACSSRCGRLFNTHGCSEKEYEQEVIVKRCELKTCNKQLYKRDDEPFGN